MPSYLEFDIWLKDIKPRIWRRLLLRSTSTFSDLNDAIQDSFGWTDTHLWHFLKPGTYDDPIAGLKYEPGWEGPGPPDAKRVKLRSYFEGEKTECAYVYDFGDCWEHEVSLVQTTTDKDKYKRRLLAGERACPPENAGGSPGYERFVKLLETGEDIHGDDPAHLLDWLGDWKPDDFDLKESKVSFDC